MLYNYKTLGFNGYSVIPFLSISQPREKKVESSPFYQNKLCVATSQYYGIVGNGRLYVLTMNPSGEMCMERFYETQDGLYDLTFNEQHDQQVLVASGDGTLKLFDFNHPDFPIKHYKEHSREVFSVCWNGIQKNTFLSSSWDCTIKLWDPQLGHSIQTWKNHSSCVYQAIWSPHDGFLFGSCSGDQKVCIQDIRQASPSLVFQGHSAEILSLDWNKYEKDSLVTGAVDRSIRVWDLRNPRQPKMQIPAHELAVRRIKCSPFHGNMVASCSYDMTVKIWDITSGVMLSIFDGHSEFAFGIDFSLFVPDRLYTCGWDENVFSFQF